MGPSSTNAFGPIFSVGSIGTNGTLLDCYSPAVIAYRQPFLTSRPRMTQRAPQSVTSRIDENCVLRIFLSTGALDILVLDPPKAGKSKSVPSGLKHGKETLPEWSFH